MTKKQDQLKSEGLRLTEELLYLLGIEAQVDINHQTENDEDVLNIDIKDTPESGLLIGARGSTLNSIQSFVALALRHKEDQWVRVNIDIDGWKKKHEDYLIDLATQAAMRARETGEPQNLYNLNPAQRRIVHTFLSEEKGIKTESTGEGESRYLVVSPSK